MEANFFGSESREPRCVSSIADPGKLAIWLFLVDICNFSKLNFGIKLLQEETFWTVLSQLRTEENRVPALILSWRENKKSVTVFFN